MIYAYEDGASLHVNISNENGEAGAHTFLEDTDGEMLFAFADSDLDGFSEMFLRYIDGRIDLGALQCKEAETDVSRALCESLTGLHPFFRSCDHLSALPDMLASTLNQMLKDKDCDEETYRELLTHLCSPSLALCLEADGYTTPAHDPRLFVARNYDEYKNRDTDRVQKHWKRTGVNGLLSLHQYVKAYLYWVLDASADRFSGLSTDDRLHLFGSVFGRVNTWQPLSINEVSCVGMPDAGSVPEILRRGQWKLAQRPYESDSVLTEILSDARDEIRRREYSNTLADLASDDTVIDADLEKYMSERIGEIKKETSQPLFKAYEISCFSELLLLQLRLLTERRAIIKRCRYCRRYFITERSNIEYCQRMLPGETQTCYVIGPRRVFNKNLSSDVTRGLYSKAYKKYQGRLRRKSITEAQFDEWKENAKRHLSDVQSGKISMEEYTSWMEQ